MMLTALPGSMESFVAFAAVQEIRVRSCCVSVADFVSRGLWPVNPARFEFIPFEVMKLVNTITNFSPTTSMSSIAQALNFEHQMQNQVSLSIYHKSVSSKKYHGYKALNILIQISYLGDI